MFIDDDFFIVAWINIFCEHKAQYFKHKLIIFLHITNYLNDCNFLLQSQNINSRYFPLVKLYIACPNLIWLNTRTFLLSLCLPLISTFGHFVQQSCFFPQKFSEALLVGKLHDNLENAIYVLMLGKQFQ